MVRNPHSGSYRLRHFIDIAGPQKTEKPVPRSRNRLVAIRPKPKSYLFTFWATLSNVVDRFEPSVVAAVMMAIEMRAAMRPYSMAVAPDSSARNLESVFMLDAFVQERIAKRGLSASGGPLQPKLEAGP